MPHPERGSERLWREDRIDALLAEPADGERALILQDLTTIEPLLRAGATAEIDTRRPVDEIADLLESIAGVSGSPTPSAR